MRRSETNPISRQIRLALVFVYPVIALSPGSSLLADWNVRMVEHYDEGAEDIVLIEARVWDDSPGEERHWDWMGIDDRAAFDESGAAEGTGRLTWRAKDSSDYDFAGVLAVYEGEVKGGRRHGRGSLIQRDGTRYRGTWMDDRFHGEGALSYPNGDYYTGGFSDGLAHGEGHIQRHDGSSWRGRFVRGVPDGAGVAALSQGEEYESVWEDGQETAGSLATRRALEAKTPPPVPGLKLDLVSNPAENAVYSFSANTPVAYRSFFENGRLRISPDSDIWSEWIGNSGVLPRFYYGEAAPVFLDLVMASAREDDVVIIRGEVEVESSVPDLRPYLCLGYNAISDYDFSFSLHNLGYGKVLNPELSFNLFPRGTEEHWERFRFVKKLEAFDLGVDIDLSQEFAEFGVDLEFLEENRYDFDTLVDAAMESEIFGPFAVKGEDGAIVSAIALFQGILSFEWIDHEGGVRRESGRLSGEIEMLHFAEGGEGIEGSKIFDLVLREDQANYRIPFDYNGRLAAGTGGRFALKMGAGKSSFHRLKVTLHTADGERIASPWCELHFFSPRLVTSYSEGEFEVIE